MLLAGDRHRGDVIQPARILDSDLEGLPPAAGVEFGAVRVGGPACLTSVPESTSRTTTFHDCVEESTPATRVIGSAGSEQMLGRQLVQPDETIGSLGRSLHVEVLEGRRVNQELRR